jgi:peptidoglycan/xylan/chitin deacetylase (PgdA/CDA1 family)
MNKIFTVFIPPDALYFSPIWHTLRLIEHNKDIQFVAVDSPQLAQFVIGENIKVAISFYEALHKGIFSHAFHFKNDCFIQNTDLSREYREVDFLATIFYIVNCLQEYNPSESVLDKYGRFRYDASFQYRFKNITENIVQYCIDAFCSEHNALKHLSTQHKTTKILLTHDIDSLYGAWKFESRWAMKQGRLGLMLKIMAEFFLQNHSWFNIDKILKIHNEYELKSTFFWITQQGRDKVGIKNADYNIQSSKIKEALNSIQNAHFEIGLHKSTLETSFKEELRFLPQNHVAANRFHFLKFNIPQSWQQLEAEAMAFDASLAFAEAYGFRNGYGLPFEPFDWSQQRTLKTLITPLNIMDGTLGGYMEIPVDAIEKHIMDFLEKHKTDALMTLLWHNTEFSEYSFKEYLDIYKNILKYIKESKIEVTTINDVLKAYKH